MGPKKENTYVSLETETFVNAVTSAALQGYFNTSYNYTPQELITDSAQRAKDQVRAALERLMNNEKGCNHSVTCLKTASFFIAGKGHLCSEHANVLPKREKPSTGPYSWPNYCNNPSCSQKPTRQNNHGYWCINCFDQGIWDKCQLPENGKNCNQFGTYLVGDHKFKMCVKHAVNRGHVCCFYDESTKRLCTSLDVKMTIDRNGIISGFCKDHIPKDIPKKV